ncbi:MAG TPA: archaellin/type IV pilin N-terminal domain-containing protein [Anaerolineae bacterium]|nr:archaellin/type IV pilin N-terminal domain-containing protein [Anaerolineae bacterium]
MNTTVKNLMKDESGITALETAIILIAFVVVAAIFAFTVLSTGTFLTERSKEAAYAGLQEVRGSMELKGSVVLEDTGDAVVFNLATVAGGSSVDLSKVKMMYRDSVNNVDLTYDATATAADGEWIATTAETTPVALKILASGQLAKIEVNLTTAITANQVFALEIKPPSGGVMVIERTAPAQIDMVTDLH